MSIALFRMSSGHEALGEEIGDFEGGGGIVESV